MMDLAFGYAYKLPPGSFVHSVKIKFQLDNVLNRKVLVLNSVGPPREQCLQRASHDELLPGDLNRFLNLLRGLQRLYHFSSSALVVGFDKVKLLRVR